MKNKLVAVANPIINQQSYLPNWREILQTLPTQPASRPKKQRIVELALSVLSRK